MPPKTILGDDPFAPAAPPTPPAAAEAPVAEAKAPIESPSPVVPPQKSVADAAPAEPARKRPKAARADEVPAIDYGPSIDPVGEAAERAMNRRDPQRIAYRPEASSAATALERGPEVLWRTLRKWRLGESDEGVDAFGRSPAAVDRYRPLFDFLQKSYFRVEASGLGHLPDVGRGLVVANHSGMVPYDSLMISHVVRREHERHREVRPLVEDFLFHFPFLGTLLNRLGAVRACPENAERLLDEEQLVAVFPEGEKGISKLFRDRYQLQRFGRGGFIRLALRKNAPIIPTAVVGAEEIHPTLGRLTIPGKPFGIKYLPLTPTFPWLGPLGLVPLPSKWLLAFGEPMYVGTEYGPEGADDRVLVNRLAEQVRNRIQTMLDELVARRKTQ